MTQFQTEGQRALVDQAKTSAHNAPALGAVGNAAEETGLDAGSQIDAVIHGETSERALVGSTGGVSKAWRAPSGSINAG